MGEMRDVLVIGKGPGGISAAIYAKRAGMDVLVLGRDGGALDKAEWIENYYGFVEPVSGHDLLEAGIAQARRLGIEVATEEVLGLSYDGNFVVKTGAGEVSARSLVIATGVSRGTPKIQGFTAFEGSGISYCAVCDGFFYRGKDVAVLGAGDYAIAEACELLPMVSSVTLLTDGEEVAETLPEGIKVLTKPIAEITGDGLLEKVIFADGSDVSLSGLFVALGVAGSGDLARKLGVMLDGKKIIVDEKMATNVPGLFAVGDCTGGMLQIAKAIHEGAVAGSEAAKLVRKAKK